ncbi:MAG: hypothetical protein IPP51_17095 [Bacteroidetes bacterium]|nr:hypothetical protein [Bacteroidota bacterium]
MYYSIKRFLAVATVLSLVTLGCKKDKTEQPEYDTQTSVDNALAEGAFNDAENISSQAIENGTSLTTYRESAESYSLLSGCATVTLTPNGSGNGGTIDVDFGSTNCLCLDYRYRRGIIHVVFTGAYRDSGTVITTTFTNYYVGKDQSNMFQVTGTKTVTNMGHNAAGNLTYHIVVDGHLINANQNTMNWQSTRDREWVAGESTIGLTGWTDDVYHITGSATGVNFEGTSYTANITSPLDVALNCRYIRGGVFELTPSGKPTRTLDYGNGNCDDSARVTINGVTFNIILR